MVITLTLFGFSYFTLISGQTLYESWVYTSFNFALGMPIVIYGILDRDVSADFALKNPQIYITGKSNVMLCPSAIGMWVLNALFLSLVVISVYFFALYDTFSEWGLYEFGTTTFVSLILGLTMKVLFLHNQINYIAVFFICCSLLGFYIWMLIVNSWLEAFPDYFFVARWSLKKPLNWFMSSITIPIVFGLIDLIGQGIYIFFYSCTPDEVLFREKSLQAEGRLRNEERPNSTPGRSNRSSELNTPLSSGKERSDSQRYSSNA